MELYLYLLPLYKNEKKKTIYSHWKANTKNSKKKLEYINVVISNNNTMWIHFLGNLTFISFLLFYLFIMLFIYYLPHFLLFLSIILEKSNKNKRN